MFDSLFNFVIILIPLAIFIGRFVVQARNKNAPKPPPPRIPVHFEDDEDDERGDSFAPHTLSHGAAEYFRGLSHTQQTAAQKAAQPRRPSVAPGKLGESLNQQGPGNLAASLVAGPPYTAPSTATSGSLASGSPAAASPSSAAQPEQGNFFARLSQLSPMKQAVIMAEVLGPPKGEQ